MAQRHGAIGYPVAAEGAFEIPGGGERTLWFLLTTRNPVDIEAVTLARENAAIDAEDIFTQAEEANAVHPVG